MGDIYRYTDIPFHVPPTDAADLDLDTEAPADVPGRKFLARGAGGFYSQIVRIPPHFVGPVHAHDHAEIFLVLAGSCRFNDDELGPFDSTVVEALEQYGFEAGPEGVQFLVVRQAPSGVRGRNLTRSTGAAPAAGRPRYVTAVASRLP